MSAPRPEPPHTEAELLTRAHAIAGRTLGELATAANVPIPAEPRRAKGLAGRLVEHALGADAGSAAAPDFSALGVELKTIPLAADGRPRESTFVCSIRLSDIADTEWERSRDQRKLARVLWVPIERDPARSLADRRIGTARLWSPSPDQEAALRADWEELAGLIGRGEHDALTARLGQYLQVRPKAANASVRARGSDEAGAPVSTPPRGFYLRTRFTAQLFV